MLPPKPLICLQIALIAASHALTITNGHCEKNVSIKYQVPVTKTRLVRQSSFTEQYVDWEQYQRWDTVHICCPGYRTIIFGFCEPICVTPCPAHSYCAQPEKCECMRGYEASHHPNKEHQLICRPVCVGGCPEHSHCMGPNTCECRPGYNDISGWFMPMLCERVQCGADQRYDVERRACVKIDMSVEELMQKVAEKLTRGLNATTEDEEVLEEDDY